MDVLITLQFSCCLHSQFSVVKKKCLPKCLPNLSQESLKSSKNPSCPHPTLQNMLSPPQLPAPPGHHSSDTCPSSIPNYMLPSRCQMEGYLNCRQQLLVIFTRISIHPNFSTNISYSYSTCLSRYSSPTVQRNTSFSFVSR